MQQTSVAPSSTAPVLGWTYGVLLCALLAVLAGMLAEQPAVRAMGVSVLPLAIVLGMVIGNLAPRPLRLVDAGIQFAKGRCLRLGIVLFGFHLTWHELAAVGAGGLALAVTMLSMAFLATVYVGTRYLGLERDTCILIGAGSAICGAAAVLATEPVVRGRSEQVAVAIATVVLFGTLAMFIYPLLFPYLGLSETAYGRYAGATIHEVAQVVVAGAAVGQQALHAAVVEKMLRVLLLAPFLLMLSAYLMRRPAKNGKCGENDESNAAAGAGGLVIPWFALGFVAIAALNSTGWVPEASVAGILKLDAFLLAMAMAALGLSTRMADLRRAGWRPMLLAAMTAVLLLSVGYALSMWWLG